MLDFIDYKKEPIKDERFNWHEEEHKPVKIEEKTCSDLINKGVIVPIKLQSNNH